MAQSTALASPATSSECAILYTALHNILDDALRQKLSNETNVEILLSNTSTSYQTLCSSFFNRFHIRGTNVYSLYLDFGSAVNAVKHAEKELHTTLEQMNQLFYRVRVNNLTKDNVMTLVEAIERIIEIDAKKRIQIALSNASFNIIDNEDMAARIADITKTAIAEANYRFIGHHNIGEVKEIVQKRLSCLQKTYTNLERHLQIVRQIVCTM